jgi:hypothetical protein
MGIIYAGFMLRLLSQRMGEVSRIPNHHRWYRIGNGLMGAALLSHTLRNSAALIGRPALLLRDTFALWGFHLPLALGVTINVWITALYWNWLLKEW